jgi:glyoxylase-like metal-dependent hydrolase (beta-lactamase superfamily II)
VGIAMRKIKTNVYLENRFSGVQLGLIVTNDGLLLIDNPIRLEDGRAWLSQVSEFGDAYYTVLLDHHPDRIVGARDLGMPIIGHRYTRQHLASKSDSFKGSAHPIGAETDRLKRITGLSRSIPDMTFLRKLKVRMGDTEIEFWYRPGPTRGAIWVVSHEKKVIFIGDSVWIDEPPYIGQANLGDWLASLDDLRSAKLASYKIVSSRDGLIKRSDINSMARLVRKFQIRVERFSKKEDPEPVIEKATSEIMSGYKLSDPRMEIAKFRVQTGFEDLYKQLFEVED